MKKTEKWVALGLTAILVLSITACGAGGGTAKNEGKDGPPYVGTVLDDDASEDSSETDAVSEDEYAEEEEMGISEEEITLLYGRGTSVDVYGADGDITWDVDNPDVLEIEADGSYAMVTGKNVGEATITVKTKQGERFCHVRVASVGLYLQDDRGYSGAASSGTYALGKQHTYSAFVDGTPVSASDLTWKSFDETVATVENGVVTMAGEGVTYISATDKNGNTAYAPIWVSDTDDELEFETKIPGNGLFLNNFVGYDEHILEHIDGEGSAHYADEAYDNGEKLDGGKLIWSVESLRGNAFELCEEETTDEYVSITYTGTEGEGFLVATNPDTGDQMRYLIVVLDLDD